MHFVLTFQCLSGHCSESRWRCWRAAGWLSASDAKKDDVNFYIAAEIENVALVDNPWKFTVEDGEKTANYVNGNLKRELHCVWKSFN